MLSRSLLSMLVFECKTLCLWVSYQFHIGIDLLHQKACVIPSVPEQTWSNPSFGCRLHFGFWTLVHEQAMTEYLAECIYSQFFTLSLYCFIQQREQVGQKIMLWLFKMLSHYPNDQLFYYSFKATFIIWPKSFSRYCKPLTLLCKQ